MHPTVDSFLGGANEIIKEVKTEEKALKLVWKLSLKDGNDTIRNKGARDIAIIRNGWRLLSASTASAPTQSSDITTAFSPHICRGEELLTLPVLQLEALGLTGVRFIQSWTALHVYCSVPLPRDSPSKAHKVSKARGVQGVIQLKYQNEISLSIKMGFCSPSLALSGNLLFPRIVPIYVYSRAI